MGAQKLCSEKENDESSFPSFCSSSSFLLGLHFHLLGSKVTSFTAAGSGIQGFQQHPGAYVLFFLGKNGWSACFPKFDWCSVSQKVGGCSFTVVIKTSCSSVSFTRDQISLAFGDAYGNQVRIYVFWCLQCAFFLYFFLGKIDCFLNLKMDPWRKNLINKGLGEAQQSLDKYVDHGVLDHIQTEINWNKLRKIDHWVWVCMNNNNQIS